MATLRALQQELPAYLEAHELPVLQKERQHKGQTFAEFNGEYRQLSAALTTAALPHLTAEERAAHELAAAVKPAEWAVTGNIVWAWRELADSREPVALLFAWESRTTIPIAPRDAATE